MAWVPEIPEILSLLVNALAIAHGIQEVQAKQATQADTDIIEATAKSGTDAVTNVQWGVQALRNLIDALQIGPTPSLTTITALINAMTPVTLPPDLPPAYGPATADSVWAQHVLSATWQNLYEEDAADTMLWKILVNVLGISGTWGWLARDALDFALVGVDTASMWYAVAPAYYQDNVPVPAGTDWTQWDGSETLVAFLNRVQPSFTWDDSGYGLNATPGFAWGHITGNGYVCWRCLVAEWQLPYRSGRIADWLNPRGDRFPPIWPGVDKVSLLTPFDVSASGITYVNCDGVLVDVGGVKPGAAHFAADGLEYEWRGGWLTFVDGTGRAEEYQFMGWNAAVYLPKHMPHAQGVCLVLRDISQCTVTPFTIP